MSTFERTIVPLIDSELELKDFDEDTGFVGAYVEDVDRPYLDNHVFLLYRWTDDIRKRTLIFYKFRELKSFHSYRIIYIDGQPMIVYTFTSNMDINHLKRGGNVIRDVSKQRILQFWNFTDSWITLNVMRGTIAGSPSSPLPLEDYMPDTED